MQKKAEQRPARKPIEGAEHSLPKIFVNAIQLDPANPDTVYVALDVGVWRSTDAGNSWTSLKEGYLQRFSVCHPEQITRADPRHDME